MRKKKEKLEVLTSPSRETTCILRKKNTSPFFRCGRVTVEKKIFLRWKDPKTPLYDVTFSHKQYTEKKFFLDMCPKPAFCLHFGEGPPKKWQKVGRLTIPGMAWPGMGPQYRTGALEA